MRPSPFALLCRLACALLLALPMVPFAQTADKPFGKEQLDQMTAQVALYPDALLSQVLMACTYPADVADAAKWSRANSEQKGDAAVKMVENESWDPSVKSLVAFPQVIVMLGEKPDWVKDLGDAFLAQPDDVMDSIQRLRAAAQKAGNLKSNEQVDVRIEKSPPPDVVVEAAAAPPPPQVIVIEQKDPEVIYVPSYNPTYVYGTWPYPAYPPYYVPYPPGYWWSAPIATPFMSGLAWGVGIAAGAAIWGGCNWWNHDVNVNVNRYNNINRNNQINANVNNQKWSHNVDNRKNTPYRGGDAQRQQLSNRAQTANRDQYRGRDAQRQQAQQSMQNRGVSTDRSQLSDANRSNLQQQARSQGYQGRGGNDAFQGVSNNRAGQEFNRGNASRQSAGYQAPSPAQRSGGSAYGGGGGRPQASAGGGSRPQMSGGGGARPSGGGGRAGGGGGGRGGGGRR